VAAPAGIDADASDRDARHVLVGILMAGMVTFNAVSAI
jgi:hypothetical protein